MIDSRKLDLEVILELAKANRSDMNLPPEIEKRLIEATESPTFSKMERFERELKRLRDDERFIIEAFRLML